MRLDLIYNNSIDITPIKDIHINIHYLNSDLLRYKKKINSILRTWNVKRLPFALVYDNTKVIKVFYNNTIEDIYNYFKDEK